MKPTLKNVAMPLLFVLTLIALSYHNSYAVDLAGTIALGVYGVLLLSFTIVYAFRDWRANKYGRAIMYTNLSILSIIAFSFLNKTLGDWEYRYVVRLVLYVVLIITEIQLLFVLIFTQKRPKETEEENRE